MEEYELILASAYFVRYILTLHKLSDTIKEFAQLYYLCAGILIIQI